MSFAGLCLETGKNGMEKVANARYESRVIGEEIREENSVQFAAIKQEIRQLQEICCPKFTIRFCSCTYYWEYLCVFKDENDMRGKDLRLRTRENVVAFGAPEKCEKTSLGTNVWRLVSTGRIKAKERYDMPMQLYIEQDVESRYFPPQLKRSFLRIVKEVTTMSEKGMPGPVEGTGGMWADCVQYRKIEDSWP